jgi:hypothetical protein
MRLTVVVAKAQCAEFLTLRRIRFMKRSNDQEDDRSELDCRWSSGRLDLRDCGTNHFAKCVSGDFGCDQRTRTGVQVLT